MEDHMGTLRELGDSASFQAAIGQNLVLVDFWAEWCGPCKALAPVLEEVAKEMGDTASILKVNVENHPTVAQNYGIRAIPTMIIFKNGKVVNTLVGNLSKGEIIKNLKSVN
jgi:thioredoxin 1